MHRFALDYLKDWKDSGSRKPIVIRGARQVGKSTLVELFAKQHFSKCVILNFEKNQEVASIFSSNDPTKILPLLELQLGQKITPGQDLLFLDEIQVVPQILTSLRYFYEELPELHIMAAGSLLDFALASLDFSMPVGRIEYLYLGPMQFEEFLLALEKPMLYQFLRNYEVTSNIPPPIHNQLLELLRLYLAVGGLPEAVRRFVQNRGRFTEAEAAKQSILTTYQDDFNKYRKRLNPLHLKMVFQRIPILVGQKFKYVNVDPSLRAKEIAVALEQLIMARIAYKVHHSAANGVPLAAQTRESLFKVLFLDVGLMATETGISALDLEKMQNQMMVHAGALCEQMIGQHLLHSFPFYEPPHLHYWVREQANAAAEVDYVISSGPHVIPVEVKAGKTGTLRSLQWFIKEKKSSLALRFNLDSPSLLQTDTATPAGDNIPFRLLSLPLYLVGQARRLLGEII